MASQDETHRNAVRDLAAGAAESAGGADAALGVNPLVGVGSGVAEVLAGFREIGLEAITHPWLGVEPSADFVEQVGRAWLDRSEVEPKRGDKRFTDPTWRKNPFYRAWMQSYLAWSDALERFVDRSGLHPKNAQRARFALSLVTDAFAPTNVWLGNPAALKRFVETGGTSVIHGFENMLDDIAHNRGLPAQVDKSAFAVGKNLALTPGAVVFRNPVLELIQYAPTTDQVYERPLLLVPPQINKFYVLDLAPGRSLIEYLVQQGIQTFVLSWRNPTPAERDWGLETYLRSMLEAIDAIREITGSPEVNILGTCSGGITTALLLGHLAALDDRRVHAATLLVTVLDTTAESQLGLFATRETIEAARQASGAKGVLEGQELAQVFAWLRPNDLVWNYWVNNYLLGDSPPAFDVLYWNNDTTNLPARLHSDFFDLYLGNPLGGHGKLELLGTPIDLARVNLDAVVLAGVTDHITPWKACYATTQMLGGRSEFILSSAGHIQSILNPPGNPKAKFFHNPHVPADADQWLTGAKEHSGSWWEYWRDWLHERSGQQRAAPKTLGSKRHRAGATAPGKYVVEERGTRH
jgi:polyhydroxyalkanoate synthase subunit PhaC